MLARIKPQVWMKMHLCATTNGQAVLSTPVAHCCASLSNLSQLAIVSQEGSMERECPFS